MERLAIKRREDLPYLIEKLKESNSPVVRDWNREFNPTLNYRTSINMRDVQIEFWGDFWEESYQLYSLFCEEYGWDLTVQNFLWLSGNTEEVNRALYGNSEFNEYVLEKGAYEEVEEFVGMHTLMELRGDYIEVIYNKKYMEMLNDLGMNFVNGKYLFRSSKGYYLPIRIEIVYWNELDWVKDANVFKRKELEIRHVPQAEVICKGKGTFYRLAKGLYQNFGNSGLIVDWVDKPYEEEYEVTIGKVKVKVVDEWKKENKDYVEAVRYLQSISDRTLEAFKVKDLIEHSEWTSYGVKLDKNYYERLNIPKEKVVKGYKEVGEGIYSTGNTLLGKRKPLVIELEQLTIHTPYELVEEGLYYEPLIPLTRPDLRLESKDYLDRDIRLVLGYKGGIEEESQEEEDIEDILFRKGTGESEDSKYELDQYPSVEIREEDLPEIEVVGEKEEQKVLTGRIEDIKNIPYVENYHQGKDELKVYYKDGDILTLRGLGGRITNLKERVLFRDSIGVDYKEYTEKLVNMLMSLSTDRVEYEDLEEESEEVKQKVRTVIDEWLGSLITGEISRLIKSVEDLQTEVVEEEEELDIFSEFEFFT